jgi:hypothetical protein
LTGAQYRVSKPPDPSAAGTSKRWIGITSVTCRSRTRVREARTLATVPAWLRLSSGGKASVSGCPMSAARVALIAAR